MSTHDFTALRQGRPECPSDLILDRYSAGELAAAQRAQTTTHLASCALCSAHVARSRVAAETLPNHAAMLARVQARLAAPPTLGERLRGVLQRGPLGLGLATACAAALVLWLQPAPIPEGGVRQKGDAVLHVHRMTETGSEEILSGAALPPGARLRFVVDLPSEGHISVIGIEAGGHLYTAWPLSAAADTRRAAGREQALPDAVALDESLGAERLYLVHCPLKAGPPRCQPGAAAAPPSCQSGCRLSPFVINKVKGS